MKKRNKKMAIIAALAISLSYATNAQVALNTDGAAPNSSAMLDVKSSDKGILIPRMSQTEIGAISSPANGLVVFNTTDDKFYAFILADYEWKEIAFGTGSIAGPPIDCDPFTDARDGQSYNTVLINTQCWMLENLNVGTMINASNGGTNGDGEQTDNGILEKYCYNNSSANCDVYGGLYQWNEMMQYATTEGIQGICPDGWHLPTDAEWCTLEQFVDPTISCSATGYRGTDGGGKLKETGNTHWSPPNAGATNSSGFTALPGGYYRSSVDAFQYINSYTNIWSSTGDATVAWVRGMHTIYASLLRAGDVHEFGFAVRCVKD